MNKINFDKCYFLIPARKGSKGFPLKNRKLFSRTADIIPDNLANKVFVTTDDEEIQNMCSQYKFNYIRRPKELATDTSSLKDVLKHFVATKNLKDDATIILLFLTYPERTWVDVLEIYEFFKVNKGTSLVCAEELEQHPFLCFYELENNKGKLLIEHKLYRRQDYPLCFKYSMFLGIYNVKMLENLHDLLVEEDTLYFKLKSKKVDVDYEGDYNETRG